MDPRPRRTRKPKQGVLQAGIGALKPARPVRVRAEGDALLLRPLALSDRKAFVRLVAESLDHLAPWLPVLADGTEPDAFFDAELSRSREGEAAGNAVRFVAEVDGVLIGAFALTNITRGLTWQADASWWVGKPFVRMGHARRGLARLLRHAFTEAPDGLALHRVMATIAPENEASLCLARAFGFARVESQDHHLRIGPAWKKHLCFAADAFEYAQREIKHPPSDRSPDRPADRPVRLSGE